MKLTKLTLYRLQIPLRFQFSHAQASYKTSHNFVLKCETDNGLTGWGEGVARSFVTGENNEDVFRAFDELPEIIWNTDFSNQEESLDFLKRGPWRPNSVALAGALELAILDLLGKQFQKSVSGLLGASARTFDYPVPVSAVLGLGWKLKHKIALHLMASYGFQQFKIKVSNQIDFEVKRLTEIRRILGPQCTLRIDANSSLNYTEAEQLIYQIKNLSIESIEDPLIREEWSQLAHLQKETGFSILLDESVRSLQEAQEFCEQGGFSINVRIGKCGGWLKALELIQWCEARRVPYQVGCHVAETGILSSAARQLLALSHRVLHVEGFYDAWLLKYQLTKPHFSFSKGGYFQVDTTRSGWGIEIKPLVLKRFSLEHFELKSYEAVK